MSNITKRNQRRARSEYTKAERIHIARVQLFHARTTSGAAAGGVR